ncbi:MAG: flagellar protein FlaG [Halieaceae bacterium]|jgi:flagellar protein FlaG|nr:flagellar protein FlaG [Halieaceae bacterium]
MAISIDNAATQPVQLTPNQASTRQAGGASAAPEKPPIELQRPVVTQEPKPVQVEKPDGPSLEDLQAAVKDLSEYIQTVSRSLQINVNSDIGRPIVTVLDSETSEVIRQIPSEEVVRLSQYLRAQRDVAIDPPSEEALTGILLNQES